MASRDQIVRFAAAAATRVVAETKSSAPSPGSHATDSLLAEFASLKMTGTVKDVERAHEVKKILADIDKELTSAVPDWDSISSQTATVFIIDLPTSKDDLHTKCETIKSSPVTIKIAQHPFARGGVRAAYHALVSKEKTTSSSSSFELKPYIVKKFLEPKNRSAEQYLDQLESNGVAKFLAKEFMKTPTGRKAERIGQRIKFIESRAIEVVDDTTGEVTWYNMENVIAGDFDKWTDNNGCCNPKPENRTLLEFAKWTHDWTDGFMMASDLQGGKTSNTATTTRGWVLTDPAMLCQDLSRFGPTNFHQAQLEMCYEGAEHALEKGSSLVDSGPSSSYYPGFSKNDDGSHFKKIKNQAKERENPMCRGGCGLRKNQPGEWRYKPDGSRVSEIVMTITSNEAGYLMHNRCSTCRKYIKSPSTRMDELTARAEAEREADFRERRARRSCCQKCGGKYHTSSQCCQQHKTYWADDPDMTNWARECCESGEYWKL